MFRLPAMEARRRRQLIRSYAPDWALTVFLGALFGALNEVDGFKRQFSLQDQTLYHPFAIQERVPPWALYILSGGAPLVSQCIINYLTLRSWWDLHNSTLGLLLSVSLASAVTGFIKVTVGRPRPDLISRCIPYDGAVDPLYGLSSVDICTQSDSSIIMDGWKSFPSGHSSMSFAGLGFLCFYLAGKLHLFDRRGCAPKAWAALTPLSLAALIAISRTMDYRHHATDIIAGSVLGLIAAYFSYRQYYPSLASEYSHRPYSPRMKREELLPLHRRTGSGSRDAPLAEQVDVYTDAEQEMMDDEETVPRDENGHEIWKDDRMATSTQGGH